MITKQKKSRATTSKKIDKSPKADFTLTHSFYFFLQKRIIVVSMSYNTRTTTILELQIIILCQNHHMVNLNTLFHLQLYLDGGH